VGRRGRRPGRARAALHPVEGRDRVAAFIAGLPSRYSIGTTEIVEANGAPAVWTHLGGQEQLSVFDIRDGLIHAIYAVLNPEKLDSVR
jgi:RNA polymerase sigma-70 factor (ECF subfamily)